MTLETEVVFATDSIHPLLEWIVIDDPLEGAIGRFPASHARPNVGGLCFDEPFDGREAFEENAERFRGEHRSETRDCTARECGDEERVAGEVIV